MKHFFMLGITALFIAGIPITQGNPGAVGDAEIPRIVLTPDRALIDENVTILLRGLPVERSVIVRVRVKDDQARTWESRAEFLSDSKGEVDVATQKPLSGTYDNVDPTGLFWSMMPQVGDKAASGFVRDSLKPVFFEFTAEVAGKAIAEGKLERLFVASGVERIQVREQGLRGTFFSPPGKGPYPGIIVLAGSGGGLQEGRAAFFASKGYAALALAYFAFEDLPKSLENIPLEYFETAIHWLQSRPEVGRDHIAVMGGSRGGELVLLLGATFPEIGAVIASVPSGVMWGGVNADERAPEQPSWSYRGKALPFMRSDEMTPEQKKKLAGLPPTKPIAYTPGFLIMLDNPRAVEKAYIPVEKIKGAVLLISGKDDQMWPSSVMAEMVMKRLAEAKYPFPHRHLSYEKAGHSFHLPNLPTTVNTIFHPIMKMDMALGGTARNVAAAAADSWKQIFGFLDEAFRK